MDLLEKLYQGTTQNPPLALRQQISAQIGMTPRRVQVWFQNRRAKDRRMTAPPKVKTSDEEVEESLSESWRSEGEEDE